MCGIAGFYGKFDSELLKAMGQSINHRGPDGSGEKIISFRERKIGLSHRRLSILDLSLAGSQPMSFSPDGAIDASGESSLWLTYNGEIYNFPELKEELEKKGHQFKSRTDTEVILHLYAEYGLEAFSKLNGIFALALFDGRDQGHKDGIRKGDLLLFRDGLGVKPLYYSETEKGFLFASEIKALLCSKDISTELDLQSLRYYLSYLYSPAPRTPFQGVKKVEPGEWLLIRNGRIHIKEYFYDIPYGETLKGSEEEITLELRSKLQEAAKRQLLSDVPVGAFLSGGLDSTSVVALMKQAEPSKSFHCFTIGHENKETSIKNDLYYAKEVAGQLGFPLSIVEVTPGDFKFLEKVIFHLDEPQADPAAINALLISKKASELGIKVLLSGAGGDDIFSGYPRHKAVQLEKIWQWVPGPIKKGLAFSSHQMAVQSGGATLLKNYRIRKVAKVFESLQWNLDERLSSHFMCTFFDSVEPILGERFHSDSSAPNYFEPFIRSLNRVKGEKSILNRMLYLETKHFLADHNLNYVDKMSMSQGVEVRVPLIDQEVVNFVAKIPANLKCRNLENKYIFKQAMRPFVPEAIMNRKKQGFGLPIRHWLNTELADIVSDCLSESSLKNRGLFNPSAVSNLIKRDRAKQIDATFLIFSMMSIEMWCRQFLDKR